MSRARHRGGWRPSRFDGRDLRWANRTTFGTANRVVIPFGPRDQGDANCCVAIALVSAMESLDAQNDNCEQLSPLFNYFLSRSSSDYTGGVPIRDALDSAVRDGICASSQHEGESGPEGPYTRADALRKPAAAAYQSASDYRLLSQDEDGDQRSYYSLEGPGRVGAWKSALDEGSPVIFGFYTTQSYDRLRMGPPFEVRDVSSDWGGSGHAVLAFGYEGNWFHVLDCRGTEFADAGRWRLHEDAVAGSWVQDSWAVAAIGYDT